MPVHAQGLIQELDTEITRKLREALKVAKSPDAVARLFYADEGESNGVWFPENLDVLIPTLHSAENKPEWWEMPKSQRDLGFYFLCWTDNIIIIANDASGTTERIAPRKNKATGESITRILDRLPKDRHAKFFELIEASDLGDAIDSIDLISLLDF